MKKQVNILFLIGSLAWVLLPSCQLDEAPYSSIFTDSFYATAQDAEAAITAAYDPVADIYGGPAPLLVADFSADQVYPRPVVGRNTFTLYNYDPNYTTQKSFNRTFESPVNIWQSCYDGIEKANWVIDKVPNTNMDATRKAQIIGEAYFLRAYYHWMATKNFGDVVVKTSPSKSEEAAIVGKSPQSEVYVQIYADLELAAAGLPDYSAGLVKGRASKQAALALHAKAALYDQKWSIALDKAQQVINSGVVSLMPNVKDLYDVTKEDAARIENIFAFESEGNPAPSRASQITSLYGPRNSDGPEYGKTSFGSIFVYPSFFDSFDPQDARRALLDTFYVKANGTIVHQNAITPITTKGVLCKKYQDPISPSGTMSNIPILRVADVYLVAAEAEAQLNGGSATAYGFINAVRNRATLPDLAAGLGKEAFIDAVIQERAWELFAEGDRWYDLTRTGKFLTVIPAAVNDVFPERTPLPKHKFFPIPLDEILANPLLVQNPDWQ